MRTAILALALGLSAPALAATPDAAQAQRSYAVADVELESSEALLRGLDALSRADATWDHQHPAKLFADTQRAVLTATDTVGELRELASGQRAGAAPALDRAQSHLGDASSDLRALAGPALGLKLPPAERARAVARLRQSLSAARSALHEAAPGLGVP